MEHTNLAARTDMEAGIFIVKLSQSVMVMKMTKTRDNWILLTKKTAWIASKISLGDKSRAKLDLLWKARKAIE